MGRAARMARHHKRAKSQGELNLVSMIDMLTVLVFFLLVYTTNEVEILPSAKDVQLPQSIAEATAREAVVVVVSETEILMNGESLGKISDILKSKELIIPKLKTALENEVKRSVLADAELTEEQRIASREVTIMADKEIPYQLLKRVMATSTAADYGQLSLAVLQKASEARLATVARN
ncbi:MAG TPA: biopolymer transporter ExbD [Gammaproteobacteria bacterium]